MSKPSLSESLTSVARRSLDLSHKGLSAANPNSHPLSPDSGDPSFESFITNSNIDTYAGYHRPRRRPPSIKSSDSLPYDPPEIRTQNPPPAMITSNPSTRNPRNRIFDEYITSTAHPTLQAHSLIPLEIVDDEKAVRDMLAEAMNEAAFITGPPAKVEEEETTPRPATPMSAIDIPVRKSDLENKTRPRSASSLSLRRWAGVIVGRGDPGKRSAAASTRPKLTHIRSSSDIVTDTSSVKTAVEETSVVIDEILHLKQAETAVAMSRSSSGNSMPSIQITSPKTPRKASLPSDYPLHRVFSAPSEDIPSLEQMRTEAVKSITQIRSPTRLRATTVTTETRSRSGSESTPPKPPLLSQSSSSTSLTSLGQRSPAPTVELDTIVPPEIQPPSLSARWDDHYKAEESGLTDRYGFIVQAAHRKDSAKGEVIDLRESLREMTRSDEERWKNVTSETEDRIEELRKMGAKPRRSPSPFVESWNAPSREEPTTSSVVMSDMRVHSPAESKPTSPLAHEVFPVEVVATDESLSNTEPIVPMRDPVPLSPHLSVSTPPIPTLSNASDLSTIKLLLSKLNDLHDSLDRANKQRWDKWLSQSDPTDSLLTPPPGTKDRKQRLRDFKTLVMGGIPVKYRSKIWAECSGATELSRPGYFEELTSLGVTELDPSCVQQIEMDIHRTMPNNVFFGGNGPGIAKLERVLIAFARHNPTIGYCQGMNVITATLLLVHSTDEEAFWGLVAIIERILPEGYFTPDLIGSRADQRVLKRLVREISPRVHIHLQRLGVDLEAITFNWFLSVFTDCLPAEALFRVWDVFFVEGSAYMFRIALSIIKINEKLILACKTPASVYSFMKDMTSRMLPIDKLISMSCEGLEKSVRNDLIETMRKAEIEALKREMEELYQYVS